MVFRTRPASDLLRQVRDTIREEDVQRDIINALCALGYIVLSTSEHRRREHCPHCHQVFTPSAGRGTTPGVPDLIVTHERFAPGVFVGLEVKGPRTAISPAQAALEKQGRIFIVRSAAEAVEVMRQSQFPSR